ncbi:MAG: hypothetical protein MZV70_43845 [Desulfobacterales bacterium]|nr:hypothetical protein [Desulfobacterales bacterium]
MSVLVAYGTKWGSHRGCRQWSWLLCFEKKPGTRRTFMDLRARTDRWTLEPLRYGGPRQRHRLRLLVQGCR